jgi:bleomycin hydrolase
MSVTENQLRGLRDAFDADRVATLMQNAVSKNNVKEVILNRSILQSSSHSVNTKLDDWDCTNQKASGRCWLFAVLNMLRPGTMKKMNVKNFEFSQAHIHFWDKFERANCFLEAIIETANMDVDDRTVHYILHDPIGDGGQYGMATELIKKHGLVPKEAYPESHASSQTLHMNVPLRNLLRSSACELRAMLDTGSSVEETRAHKEKRVGDVWRLLCIHLGTPPESFDWQWKDKDNKLQRHGIITPQEFAAEYASHADFMNFVCLVNDPRNEYYQTYTVDKLQNVHGGPPVIYLNVPIQEMKNVTQRMLQDGSTVWMGCDVGKCMDRGEGLWVSSLDILTITILQTKSYYTDYYIMNANTSSITRTSVKMTKLPLLRKATVKVRGRGRLLTLLLPW